MASNEGIGSPFRKQPPARFPKLHIYESLFLLNEGVDHLIILLNDLKKFPIVDEESVRCAIVDIEKSRCDMNADLTEKLADRERFDEGRFWRQRREFEKKWRDPDDVNTGVKQRKKKRKKKDSRLVSVYSHIPQWPTKNEYGRPSRSGRKARHDGSKVKVEESDHGEETEDRVGRKHPRSADHSQGKKEAARDDEEAPRDAA